MPVTSRFDRPRRRARRPWTDPVLAGAVLLGLLAFPNTTAATSTPRVDVVDVNPELGGALIADPVDAAYWAGRLVFRGRVDDGTEPYVTDGTPLGTGRLADIEPGVLGSEAGSFVRVGPAENLQSRVFFVAETEAAGRELWVTDGTTEGTVLAVDFAPGPDDGLPSALTAFSGDLFVTADAGTDRLLYRVDRVTLAASELGGSDFTVDIGAELVETSTRLFLAATSKTTGETEIWSTDGASVDEETAAGCDDIGDLHVAGDTVFFVCERSTSIDVLQVDDGETEGFRTIRSHAGAASVSELTHAGGFLYWNLDAHRIFALDADTSPPVTGAAATYAVGADVGALARVGSVLVYRADSGDGLEPHVAEGFASSQLDDVFGGPAGSLDVSALFVEFDGTAYFRADDGVSGSELWRTDGTPEGTELAADLEDGEGDSNPGDFVSTPMGLFFTRDGGGLWVTDGLAAVRADALQMSSISVFDTFFDPIGDRLFFTRFEAEVGTEPWVSDGTEEGTFRLRDIHVGSSGSRGHDFLAAFPAESRGASALVVFSADDGVDDEQLWETDGTPGGTGFFSLVNDTGDDAEFSPGAFLGDEYFFGADDGSHGRELWRSDGTPGGTALFADLDPFGSSLPEDRELVVFDGWLYLAADDGDTGTEVYRTDGTSPPSLFVDLSSGPDSGDPDDWRVTPSRLWFRGSDGNDDFLWRSDGTPSGTEPVLATPAFDLTAVGDAVFFRHDDGVAGQELWRADANSVSRVVDLWPGPTGSILRLLGSAGGRVIFRGENGAGDGVARLWSSDGTADEALLLGEFVAVGTLHTAELLDHLYFVAEVEGEGSELWRTDGTTVERIDLEPGPTPSEPRDFVAGGNRLFFLAYDSTAKVELHVLIDELSLFADGFETGDTSAW